MIKDQQNLPEFFPLPDRGSNIWNQNFGSLTAVYPCGTNSQGVLWVCRCDCGRYAIRSVGRLNRGKKLGHQSCCSVCHSELLRGYFLQRRSDHKEFWAKVFRETGSLYRAELDFGDSFVVDPVKETNVPSLAEQFKAESGSLVTNNYADGFTLNQIADDWNLSRERIRQIELKAIKKLQQPHIARMINGDEPKEIVVKEEKKCFCAVGQILLDRNWGWSFTQCNVWVPFLRGWCSECGRRIKPVEYVGVRSRTCRLTESDHIYNSCHYITTTLTACGISRSDPIEKWSSNRRVDCPDCLKWFVENVRSVGTQHVFVRPKPQPIPEPEPQKTPEPEPETELDPEPEREPVEEVRRPVWSPAPRNCWGLLKM